VIISGEVVVDVAERFAELRLQFEALDPGVPHRTVNLAAGRQLPFREIRWLMSACAAAGFTTVSFVVTGS
jgi:biopolymer transport protein ExbD